MIAHSFELAHRHDWRAANTEDVVHDHERHCAAVHQSRKFVKLPVKSTFDRSRYPILKTRGLNKLVVQRAVSEHYHGPTQNQLLVRPQNFSKRAER